MENLRVAVIGTGGVSQWHLAEYAKKPNVEIVGLSDTSPFALTSTHKKYPGAYADVNWSQMLATTKPDVVSVCSPGKFHAEHTLAALAIGAHVVCEKPLAMNVAEALQMEAARAQAGKIGVINFSYRNCPSFRFARELIARGELGTIQRLNCVYLQSFVGAPNTLHSWRNDITLAGFGAMGDLGVHMIDSAAFVTGMKIDRVVGVLQTSIPSKKDRDGVERPVTTDTNGSFLAQFSNGAIGTFETTQTAPGYGNYFRIEVSGTLGTLIVLSEQETTIWMFQGRVTANYGTWNTSHPALSIPTDFINSTPPRTPACIIEVIRGESNDYPSFKDGVAAQLVLEGIVTSTRTGQWVNMAP